MINGKDLARTGCRYLGEPYSRMDCQAFWERALADCGLRMDLGGSNSWYREMKKNGWVGTPEECRKEFGEIPMGATLYIRQDVSADTPAQFRDDGIGDITHMGIYTGMSGKLMVHLAEEQGVKDAGRFNFGSGAIHSSSSREFVCTSKFEGKSINGGWNRVGLYLSKINYGDTPAEDPQEPEHELETETAIVVAEHGDTVKMRAKPSQDCKLYWDVPIGSEVIVDDWRAKVDKKGQTWSKITWSDRMGYMIRDFLWEEEEDPDQEDMWTVTIPGLSKEEAEELCADWSGATMERG